MSNEALKNAVLEGSSKGRTTRPDFLKKILNLSSEALSQEADANGDTNLAQISRCSCIDRIRRMAAVNSQESPEDTSFKKFTAMILGEKYAHTPQRRFARRRRR